MVDCWLACLTVRWPWEKVRQSWLRAHLVAVADAVHAVLLLVHVRAVAAVALLERDGAGAVGETFGAARVTGAPRRPPGELAVDVKVGVAVRAEGVGGLAAVGAGVAVAGGPGRAVRVEGPGRAGLAICAGRRLRVGVERAGVAIRARGLRGVFVVRAPAARLASTSILVGASAARVAVVVLERVASVARTAGDLDGGSSWRFRMGG
jgi:hypothetical protein